MANSKCIEANRDNIVAMQRSFSDIDYVALLAERKISIAIEEIKLVLAQPDTGAMRSTIQTLCETIHFHAFDAMNVANCEAERWGANYVNEVERAERHAKCSAAAATTVSNSQLSAGSAEVPYPELPFVTLAQDPSPGWNHFDVPLESYSEGNQTGVQVAWQLMRAYALTPKHQLDAPLYYILKDAATALEHDDDRDSQHGAAIGFFTALEAMLSVAAKTMPWEASMDEQLKREERFALDQYRDGVRRNDEFRAAMKLPPPVDASGAEAKHRAAEIKTATCARKANKSKQKTSAEAVAA